MFLFLHLMVLFPGGFPYPTLGDRAILPFLLKGNRLERPENCTNELYSLMLECWSHQCEKRPSFKSVLEYLDSITNNKRAYVDFSHLNPSYVFPPTQEQTIPKNYALSLPSVQGNITIEIISPGSAETSKQFEFSNWNNQDGTNKETG